MPTLPTTENAIRGLAPAPGEPQTRYWDAKVGGLVLLVGKGSKSWGLSYRAGGKRRHVTLGQFPDMGLAAARKAAEAHRVAVDDGADPQALRKARRAAETVSDALDRWIAMHINPQRTAAETTRRINVDIRPFIGDVKLPDLRTRHLVAVLDRIMLRGSPVSANRCLDVLASFTGWLHGRDELDHDPAAKMADPAKEQPRERALTDAELTTLWRALDGLSDQAGFAVRLLILTGRRTEEITGLPWPELDLDAGVWALPGERNKSGRPWEFPLATPVLAMLRERWEAQGRPTSGHVLRGKRTRGREPTPTPAIVARCKVILDGAHREEAAPVLATAWQIRDLRRTARTGWGRLGVQPHVAELMLGHTMKGLTAVYDVGGYLPEMRAGFELWASHVLALVDDPPGGRVLPMTRVA